MGAIVIGCRLAGLAGFDAYPLLTLDSGGATIAAALALPIAAGLPFANDALRSRLAGARRG
jgi:hypothetical protein